MSNDQLDGTNNDITDEGGLSFDQNFNSTDTILNQDTQLPGVDFDHQFDIKARKISISSLVNTSGVSTADASGIGTGIAVTLTTQLSPKFRNIGLKNMAIPYVAIYEGTGVVGSLQLYPKIGSGETAEKIRVYSGFDWNDWSGSTQTSLFKATIYNNAGTALTIHAVTQWQFIQNNGGTSL